MQEMVNLKAKEILRKAVTLDPEKTLYDVRNAMMRYNISRVVLKKGKKPAGIITEKDIPRFLYRTVATRRIDEVRADEVMSKDLITVKLDAKVSECSKLMLDKEISSLIVVDNEGNLKGIITKSDLVTVYATHYTGKNLVDDYMTKHVFTVAPDETTHMVLSLMANNKVSRIVVTRGKRPVGIITGRDLLPMSALFGPDTYKIIKEAFSSHEKGGIIVPSGISAVFLASDVMKYDPITVKIGSDLADPAQIMIKNRISGVPVVKNNDELVGIVTKTDVVRALQSE